MELASGERAMERGERAKERAGLGWRWAYSRTVAGRKQGERKAGARRAEAGPQSQVSAVETGTVRASTREHLLLEGLFAGLPSIDYFETFALMANWNTMMLVLSIVANLDWPLLQLDVKNAFLKGDLKKEYMDSFLGFEDVFGSRVFKLKKKNPYIQELSLRILRD